MLNYDYIPSLSLGEWLVMISAVITVAIGLINMIYPRAMTWLSGAGGNEWLVGPACNRGTLSGFKIGLGSCILLLFPPVQTLLALALGVSWACNALGRLVSAIFDRAINAGNIVFLLSDLLLAAMPLAYALGYVN